MADWNVDLYNRFKAQRQQPFEDLLALLPPRVGGSWIDLGCGDGRLTRLAAERLGAEEVLGVDDSEAMIAATSKGDDPEGISLSWRRAGVDEVLSEEARYDLVLCNAVLQFVDDHDTVFPKILDRVAPGGWVAMHIPYNHIARTHLLLEAASNAEEFQDAFDGFDHRWPQQRPEVYARALKNAGFDFTSVQLRTYRHALEGVDAIVNWIKGGAARPFLAHLDDGDHGAFLDKYGRLVSHAYPPVEDDLRLLDYTRLLIVGHRPRD